MTLVRVAGSAESVGSIATAVVLASLAGREHPVLGVATGSSPLSLYEHLAERVSAGGVCVETTTLVALDEYVGLAASDPRSYAAFISDRIAKPLGIAPAQVLAPDGAASDPEREAREFDRRISGLGGVDVQICGIGSNGHLAFNEPGSRLDSMTRVVELTERTRTDNARFFSGQVARVPRSAITQGLATISRARSIVLVAHGAHKAAAISAALEGPVGPDVPATILQRHPDVTVVVDEAAAGMLTFSAPGSPETVG